MTNTMEAFLASHVFGTGTFSKPATIAIALTSTPPTDTDTGASSRELADTGAYARQAHANGAGAENRWTDPVAADGIVYNLGSPITFPVATAAWGWVSGVLITDNTTHGAGNALVHGTLTTPKYIDTNDQLVINASGIQIQHL